MDYDPDKLRLAHQHLQKKISESDVRKQGLDRYAFEKQQRILAGKGDAKRIEPTFLRPQDIEKGVEYDVEKLFTTTLNGELRRLTRNDLIAFQKNIELLQDQYKKGITAKQVISLSLDHDIQKANQQIYMAVPISMKNGVVHFMTNASKESADKEHHLHVQFLNYGSMVLQPTAINTDQVRRRLSQGKLKFECDCGRHTYWFRYIASIGGYGYGRQEEGYPKITNPNLHGVACKHALRVMHHILTPSFVRFLEKQLQKERSTQAGKRQKQSQQMIKKDLEKQVKKFEQEKSRIEKNHDKATAEMLRRAGVVAKRQKQALSQAKKQQHTQTLKDLLSKGVISQEEFNVFKRGIK